jgi:hypothetical protein
MDHISTMFSPRIYQPAAIKNRQRVTVVLRKCHHGTKEQIGCIIPCSFKRWAVARASGDLH